MERRQTNEKRYQFNHEYADQARAEKKKPIWVTLGETCIAQFLRAARAWTLDRFGSPKISWYLQKKIVFETRRIQRPERT